MVFHKQNVPAASNVPGMYDRTAFAGPEGKNAVTTATRNSSDHNDVVSSAWTKRKPCTCGDIGFSNSRGQRYHA